MPQTEANWISSTVSVDNTTGYWTYALTAREKPHMLYGFSYQYFLTNLQLSQLVASGVTGSLTTSTVANIKLNNCIPDDVECLLGGIHIARFRVAGSLSGSFGSSTHYTFSYGKYLKTPIQIPVGDELSLVSKINAFFSVLYVQSSSAVNQYLACQLDPGSGRLLIG